MSRATRFNKIISATNQSRDDSDQVRSLSHREQESIYERLNTGISVLGNNTAAPKSVIQAMDLIGYLAQNLGEQLLDCWFTGSKVYLPKGSAEESSDYDFIFFVAKSALPPSPIISRTIDAFFLQNQSPIPKLLNYQKLTFGGTAVLGLIVSIGEGPGQGIDLTFAVPDCVRTWAFARDSQYVSLKPLIERGQRNICFADMAHLRLASQYGSQQAIQAFEQLNMLFTRKPEDLFHGLYSLISKAVKLNKSPFAQAGVAEVLMLRFTQEMIIRPHARPEKVLPHFFSFLQRF